MIVREAVDFQIERVFFASEFSERQNFRATCLSRPVPIE
jgi:hypothetical protein